MTEQGFPNVAALLLRVSLGTMWITHGLLKVLVFTVSGFQAFLVGQGMPPAAALPVVIMELVGGVLIMLGVRGRWVSVALLPILVGATVAHAGNGWVFSNPQGGWEYPVFLIAMSLVHALLGDGSYTAQSIVKTSQHRLQNA